MKKKRNKRNIALLGDFSKTYRIMKLACLFMLVMLLQVTASTYSQNTKLSLTGHNLTIEQVLGRIEDQSDFSFFYNVKEVDLSKIVSVNVKDQSIGDVLDLLMEGTGLTYTINNKLIIIHRNGNAGPVVYNLQQNRPVRGKVTDSSGAPLPGVTVVVKGTTIGTITGVNGNYSFSEVPGDAILVFSFVGMRSQEIPTAGKTTINLIMEEETIGLEEVVAIGYGTMKKSDLTGAITRANITTLENSPNVNVLQSIKGVVPGLNIGVATTAGGNPTISIRGRNSISGTTSPLIVLDGIVYRGELTDINPNDIESIDVLKDASSAAIYGSQGANGVLMITTKSAKKMSKPIIEYSGSFSFQELINNDLDRLDRDGFLNQLADIYISDSRMGDNLLECNPDFDPTSYFRDENVLQGYLNGTNTDWWDLLSKPTPYIHTHNISLRGKSDLTSYFLSFGYTDQKNMVINDTYKRYNLRINLDAKVTDWLRIGTQSYFTVSDFSGYNTDFSNLNTIPALVDAYEEDGSIKTFPYLGYASPLLTVDNPNKDKRNHLTGNFYTDITIPWIKGLSYRLSYSNSWEFYKYFLSDPYDNALQGSAEKTYSNQHEWTLDNIVTYKRNFGKHSVNGTFVYGVEKREYEKTSSTANNFTDQTLGYNSMQSGQADLNTITSSAWKETSLYTMFRAVYTYNDRYIFTGTIRRDGFSGFGENNKFGYFPSAAVAWRISEENFLKDKYDWINNLKLRFSYGSGGNRTLGRYATLAQMSMDMPFTSDYTGGYVFGDGSSAELARAVSTMSNEDLKWETTRSFNLGIDFSVLNNRLSGNYEFYISKTHDLLYNVSIPNINGMYPNAGYDLTVPTNIGKLKNTGHEISITGIPVKTKDFEWTVTGNFSTNKNKVLNILGYDTDGDG
ncbi:MAG: SusC/RagA family TonB-linked outer membrane protein, partial [Mangrovibacterium sp.]